MWGGGGEGRGGGRKKEGEVWSFPKVYMYSIYIA